MPITTTAAVLHERGQPYRIETLQLADPGPGQLLVRIRAVGICFTDVGVQFYEQGTPLPQVLGHEGAGEVVAVGPGVTSHAPGDRVVLSYASCGSCPRCQDHAPQYCSQFMALNYGGVLPDGSVPFGGDSGAVYGGFFGQSSFATHALAYPRNAVTVTADLPFAHLAPFGCGMQTGAGTVWNSLKPRAGQSLAVIGTGGVGLAALMAAADSGCAPLVAVDRNAQRLALATELGATQTILADGRDLTLALREILPDGFDFVIDTSGAPGVARAGLEALAARGQMALLAVTPPGTEITINPNVLLGGRHLRGAVEGDADPQAFIPRLVERHLAGGFPHDRLIRTYRLDEINGAVADMKSGATIKPVLVMD